jgi:membrane protein
MRNGNLFPAKPRVMTGAAVALGLMAYGIAAKRRGGAQEPPPESSSATLRRNWRKISTRVARGLLQGHISFVAAGAAFYGFLAIPAALAVLTSVSLLIFGASAVQFGVRPIAHITPPYVMNLLSDPHSQRTLTTGLLVSLAIDVGSIYSGAACILTALKLVYGEGNKRSFIDHQMTVLALTAITVPFMLLSLALLLVLPAVIDLAPLSLSAQKIILIARWPILLALFMILLATVNRFASHRTEQRWRWLSWGAALAAAVWILGSAILSIYVTDFVPLDQSYGGLGAIMGLLTWLNLTALAVLLGAQIDTEIERERAIGESPRPSTNAGEWMRSVDIPRGRFRPRRR